MIAGHEFARLCVGLPAHAEGHGQARSAGPLRRRPEGHFSLRARACEARAARARLCGSGPPVATGGRRSGGGRTVARPRSSSRHAVAPAQTMDPEHGPDHAHEPSEPGHSRRETGREP